jgi:uncharacterized protein YebE (UPF0316 family)
MFGIGILECFLLALNTKLLQRNRKILCFIVSFISIYIWYYVIASLVENLHKWYIILPYAIGYASGDVCAILFDDYIETVAKFKGIKLKKKHLKRKKK